MDHGGKRGGYHVNREGREVSIELSAVVGARASGRDGHLTTRGSAPVKDALSKL